MLGWPLPRWIDHISGNNEDFHIVNSGPLGLVEVESNYMSTIDNRCNSIVFSKQKNDDMDYMDS